MRTQLIKNIRSAIKCGTLIAFDTETTGLSAEKDRITEIGAVLSAVDERGRIHSKSLLHEYIKPPFHLPAKIVELTGLTDTFLADKPTEEEVFPKIYKFFGESPIVLGHNVPFDIGMLGAMYKRFGRPFNPIAIDTLPMCRDKLTDLQNHKLGTVAEYFGLTAKLHSAVGDIGLTGKIYNLLVSEIDLNADQKLIRAHIKGCRYWSMYQTQRIYCDTDYGNLYIDYRKKNWGGDGVNIDEFDIDYLESQLKTMAGTDDLHQALRHFYNVAKAAKN